MLQEIIGSIDARGNSFYLEGKKYWPYHYESRNHVLSGIDALWGDFDGEWAGDTDFDYISNKVRDQLKKFIFSEQKGIAEFSLISVNIIIEKNQK